MIGGSTGRLGLMLYLGGKSCAYLFLGALAGAAGELVVRSAPFGVGSRILAITAGVLLFALGLESLGVVRFAPVKWAWFSRFLAGLGDAPLVLGFANGLLPCPLTYGFLAMAAATGSAIWGAGTLGVLALTSAVPLAVCALAGKRIGLRLPLFTGLLMIAMAVVTIYRGVIQTGAHHHMHS